MESDDDTKCNNCFRIFNVTLVVVFSLAICVALIMALIILKKSRSNRNFCRGADCQDRGLGLHRSMDTSVDPCEHFFNFTCGNYHKYNKVGEENWLLLGNNLLYYRYLETVLSDTQIFILPVKNFRDFHIACINQNYYYSKWNNSKNDLEDILIQLKWPPLTNQWNFTDFDWLNLEARLIKMGFTNSLFTFTSIGLIDKKEYILCDCGPLSKLSEKFNMTEEKKATERVAAYIQLLEGEQKYAKEIAQIFIGIEKIKNRTMSQKKLFRDTSTMTIIKYLLTLEDLEKGWKINFIKFCISIFPSYMNITKLTTIAFRNDCPFRLVDFLMQSKKRPVAGYMLLEGIVELSWFFTDEDSIKINQQYRKLHHERFASTRSHRECYEYNLKLLPDLWYYIYVKSYYSEASKKNVLKMIHLILNEAMALIDNSWLSTQSQKVMHKKLAKLKFMIDHDEEFVTDRYIHSTFGDLKFNASDMIKSVMHLKAHRFNRQWKIFFIVNVEKREIFRAHFELIVNSDNVQYHNILVILPSIMAPILYSDDYENSLNFGGLGSVIAHEIFHTIDYAALMVDDNFTYGPWLAEEDKPLFEAKVKCFVKQYSNYKLTSKFNVDGNKTLDENLADSGTLLSYRAYLKWLETNKVKKIPGLGKYNDRQIFWITYANIRCQTYDQEFLESVHLMNDVQTIGKFRVIGALSNFEEFSEDFNCPSNSGMNPKNKCKLYH